jgi:ABC-2 type transport system ATP-binding protein
MNTVVLENVHKIFRQGGFFFARPGPATHALKGVSLNVAAGEVLGLIGANGSGKSTSLKLISTVLLPDRGRVSVNGADTRANPRMVRRQVGFALATERSFFPRLTALENLEFFAALEDVPRRECSSRVRSVLHDVGLEDAADEQVMKLSSGMYQRLGIARALIKAPSVLLLDEPTRSLDVVAANQLWKLIRELSSTGITIVLATHNFAEVAAVCDRIAVLHMGELKAVKNASNLRGYELQGFYLETTGEQELAPWPEGVPA